MSLLLDALRKAERSKQAGSPELQPADPAPAARQGSPAHAELPPSTGQQQARALFEAKQAAFGFTPRARKLAIGGAGLLGLAAGGFYVWYVLSFPSPAVPQGRPAPAAPHASPAAPASAPPADAAPAGTPASSEPEAKAPIAKPSTPRPPRSALASPPKQLDSGVRLRRAPAAELAVDPELLDAYQALLAGDYVRAERLYRGVAQSDPFSVDAELGLASVSASRGDSVAASRHYRRALELDPRNPVALAGLAALRERDNPAASESLLRGQIAAQPDAASLHFALGNLYAAQSRWSEAQVAYFQAYRLEPDNADHAYNLAVSLDHLNQPRPALEYYQRALSLRERRPGRFDPAAAAARLTELRQQ